MTSQDSLKRDAAAKALEFVRPGMKLGLGTGSTAEAFVDLLAPLVRDGLDVTGVATSERTALKARALGIALDELDRLAPLDLTVDGADEADHSLDLIKGAGAALLREKIVAASSREMIVIADESKLVAQLGKFALPVEIIPFGQATTLARIARACAALGYRDVKATLRRKDGALVRTDSGNLVCDCAFGAIKDAAALGAALSAVTGVVEHGLFIGIATMLIIAHPGRVEIIRRTG
ncbi:MAG: ribose-5-phosphate isomerase RpiA [Alphaproteobacteria bacterium]|nr:ribose-5-phosphate isomerase RpiA [Alphaproteobacteria bacterium]MBV9694929.1 ribose-5-phosphate isomerase RpiA [Alphaproteobacteria bacterium]